MTEVQLAIFWAVRLATVPLVLGLIARRRARLCWSFVFYLAAINVCALLVVLWPAQFYTHAFWIVKQALYDIAKLLIGVELAWRAVRAFPGAAQAARRWVAVLLVVSTIAIGLGPNLADYWKAWEWQRGQMVAVWLVTLTGLLVYWYRLPVHRWHRAILLGLAPYFVVFSVLLELLRLEGWKGAWWVGHADAIAYLALTCWWAWSVWQPEHVPAEVPREVLVRLGMEQA